MRNARRARAALRGRRRGRGRPKSMPRARARAARRAARRRVLRGRQGATWHGFPQVANAPGPRAVDLEGLRNRDLQFPVLRRIESGSKRKAHGHLDPRALRRSLRPRHGAKGRAAAIAGSAPMLIAREPASRQPRGRIPASPAFRLDRRCASRDLSELRPRPSQCFSRRR